MALKIGDARGHGEGLSSVALHLGSKGETTQ